MQAAKQEQAMQFTNKKNIIFITHLFSEYDSHEIYNLYIRGCSELKSP